ncbi:FUSC family protein [Scandinavium sp. V105_16]|uniref:FUSC family protein n=1 Tax=Scandinavium lactucae TaxID=3095028 RepID=A0AAJ2VTL4_9ENTR|nr:MULTISPECIES: FUSC family protein [unclassified Scandinavium]MDX6020182.1 FUSC family protein [Scandinavium sp. V105_16]MDX6032171.1 FUSC family protein [Scandinavium sp. V105_12]
MITRADPARDTGLQRLARLLRPYPGRGNLMMRCLITCTLVMIISLTLRVPFLALSLIAVFYVTQKNIVLSTLTGTLFVLGTTLAVGLSILTLKLTWEYPLLRLLMASGLFFTCVYLMRATKYGVVFFLSGLVIFYTQTFADMTDNADSVVRMILWLWVAINYAIILTLIVNLLFLPQEPVAQLRAELLAQLAEIIARTERLIRREPPPEALSAATIQEKTLMLQHMLAFAIMRDKRYRQDEAWHLAQISTVSGLYQMVQQLPAQPQADELVLAQTLLESCKRFAVSIAEDSAFSVNSTDAFHSTRQGTLVRMLESLAAFSHYQHVPAESPAESKENARVKGLVMNQTWCRFALKTLLSTLVCYFIYIAADWQGIHTIMLSCIIVAQSSLGSTAHRGLLRVIGAVLGSLAALLMVILVMPHIESVVGLLAMSLPVIGLGAWIYAGSEKISYAGIQMMFTFALALLESFGPTFELVEIRDRVIGILLGVLIATVFHRYVWPEREGKLFWTRVSSLLTALAERVKTHSPQAGAEIALRHALAGCQGIAGRVAMEPGWSADNRQSESEILAAQQVLGHLSEIIYQFEHLKAGQSENDFAVERQQAAERLQYCATLAETGEPTARVAPNTQGEAGCLQPLFNEIEQLNLSLRTRQTATERG